MGAHVLRLGRRAVVDVAPDVEIVFLGLQAGIGHEPAVGGHLQPVAVDVGDLLDVLGPQAVLVLAFPVLAVGVDEEHVVALARAGLVEHQHAGRDARAVEQAAGQADHGLQDAVLDKALAAGPLLAPAEEHAVRHDHRHLAVGLGDGHHVLHEHQVGLLALLRHEHPEALLVLHAGGGVVLREGRVGDHPVEGAQLAVSADVLRLGQGVALADVGGVDAVQDHVHLADGPGGAVVVLAGQHQVARVAAGLLHELLGVDQHAARANRGVQDLHAFLGIEEQDQQAIDLGRRVELAALLAGAVGEVLDQVLVGRAQQVGKFEAGVVEGDGVEVLDELNQGLVLE